MMGTGRAVCLVKPTTGGTGIQVTEEGKQCLQKYFNEKPLVAVAIAGLARSGKSTLLNVLLKKLGCSSEEGNGFAVGHTQADTTQGIWMWSQPIPIRNGERHLVGTAHGQLGGAWPAKPGCCIVPPKTLAPCCSPLLCTCIGDGFL